MDPKNDPTSTEAELESFRQRWREEVSARAKGKAPVPSAAPARTAGPSARSKPHAPPKGVAPDAGSRFHARQRSIEETGDATPFVHQDLGDKQHGRRLDETSAQATAIASASKELKTALDHYEKAVEREAQGSLGDSVALYRKAFKVCELRMHSS
jgi:F-box protein 9